MLLLLNSCALISIKRWVCAQMTTYCIACQCLKYLIFNVDDVISGSTSGRIQIENLISKIAPLESKFKTLCPVFWAKQSATVKTFYFNIERKSFKKSFLSFSYSTNWFARQVIHKYKNKFQRQGYLELKLWFESLSENQENITINQSKQS